MSHRLSLISALLVCQLAVILAKGPTTRLEVSGGGRVVPLEITAAAALVNVWSEDFIDAISPAPAADLVRYRVAFYVLPPRESVERVMYVIQYVRGPNDGGGFVYLPGRGEEGYDLNVRTILRPTHDGQWHHARRAWSAALNRALDASVVSAPLWPRPQRILCALCPLCVSVADPVSEVSAAND